MKTVKLAAASIPARWQQVEENLAFIADAAKRAADDGAALLLLPECCITGADWTAERPQMSGRRETAIVLDGPEIARIAHMARDTGIVIAPGFYEQNDGRIEISQALIGPAGLLGVYRKGRGRSPGGEVFPVFDLGWARVGISICYDNLFPEVARILAIKGAEVLLSPFTSLPLTRRTWREQRLLPLQARAFDNRLFVLSASHANLHVQGNAEEWGYSGICCAIDPLGRVIAESEGEDGQPQYLCAELDANLQRTYFLADEPNLRARLKRIDDYRELLDARLQEQYLQRCGDFSMNLKATYAISETNERVAMGQFHPRV